MLAASGALLAGVSLEEENTSLRAIVQQHEMLVALRAEVGALRAEVSSLRQALAAVTAERDALRVENTALKARVGELERQLKRSSRNSSQPPSSDGPAVPPPPAKTPTGKPRGGQKGHKGTARVLLTPTESHDVRPAACGGCGHALAGSDPEPHVHQYVEVPPIAPQIVEHRLHALTCPQCALVTRATLPEAMTREGFGPRLTTLVAMLSVAYRLGKREVAALLEQVFGITLALGSVSACEQRVSAALAAPVEALHEAVTQETIAHADETSWKSEGKKAWVWLLAVKWAAIFVVAAKRNTAVAIKLLRSFAGILISDRWVAYNVVPGARRQLCWAHLIRHWEEFCGYGHPITRELGAALKAQTAKMFTRWHQVLAGTLPRAQFREEMKPIRAEIERLLERMVTSAMEKPAGKANEILTVREALFTFVDHEGVAPTNNFAEQLIRLAVRWRKNCFGTMSAAGARFAERMLTVVKTLQLQGRPLWPWLLDALLARRLQTTAPTLLRLPVQAAA